MIEALPDACLGRVFILFPDPWPKTRHHKRRFIQMEMLDRLARVTKPGAQLRFATDDKSYLPWALERLMANPAFEWMAERASDWRVRPADWPTTRYEAKAIRGAPTYLCFRRLLESEHGRRGRAHKDGDLERGGGPSSSRRSSRWAGFT